MVQTKCKLNNAELLVKLFCIQSKEIENKKYFEGNKENLEIMRESSPEYIR